MAVTIYEIAKLSGFSVGTVDRVLNNRGKVSQKAAAKIKEAIEKLDYNPNLVARSLTLRRKALKIGIIFHVKNNYFIEEVRRGVSAAEQELKEYGIGLSIRYSDNFDVDSQLSHINGLLDEQVNAIAITPINDPRIIQRIEGLLADGFPIFCFINDIQTHATHHFIGTDAFRMGQTTAGLFNLLSGGKERILIISPQLKMLGHTKRIEGFKKAIADRHPHLSIHDICEIPLNDIDIYNTIKRYFKANDGITCLWYATSVSDGGIKALEELGYLHKIKIVCTDLQAFTLNGLQNGYISATINQKPYLQGYNTLKAIFSYILTAKIDNKLCVIDCDIVLYENIPSSTPR